VAEILLLCGNYLIKDVDCCLQANARNIKGAHFAVGCGYSHPHL